MTSNDTAMARERQTRQSAYNAAVAARDALPANADRRNAERRINSTRQALEFWNDPVPAAPAAKSFTAPVASVSPCERPGAVSPAVLAERERGKAIIAAGKRFGVHGSTVDEAIRSGVSAEGFVKTFEVEALARQIIASANGAVSSAASEADRLADEIVASAKVAEREIGA